MSGDICAEKKSAPGLPAWVMTFADLMSLLLAFFVLLFSFSEMDKNVYKELAGSLKDAFGVQREVIAKEPPKGINIIAREFTPGIPSPTPYDEVRQSTVDDFHQHPVFTDPAADGQAARQGDDQGVQDGRVKADGKAIRIALDEEMTNGLIELEVADKRIVLRIREKASFPSGSEKLINPFNNIAEKIGDVFSGFEGEIIVSGHTDNYPIKTRRFRSNWELSSSRAVSVIHALKSNKFLKDKNYQVAAYAETRPVDTNETVLGRAKNRRVEISFDYFDRADEKYGPDVSVEDESEADIEAQPEADNALLEDEPGASDNPMTGN